MLEYSAIAPHPPTPLTSPKPVTKNMAIQHKIAGIRRHEVLDVGDIGQNAIKGGKSQPLDMFGFLSF